MKRIASIIALLAGTASFAGAQNLYDALTFSETDYYGTARTMGMGNAVAAMGGDLGTIGINPAGGAVANYSQIVLTPAFAGGTLCLTNTGLTLNYQVADTGLKGITFGFLSNTVNHYASDQSFICRTSGASRFGEMASAATGIDPDLLSSSNAYNQLGSGYWDAILAYNNGLICSYGTGNRYVGCTEGIESDENVGVPGQLNQRFNLVQGGKRDDYIFNMAFNHDDRFFWGFNLGIPNGYYSLRDLTVESAVNPSDFPISITYSDQSTVTTNFRTASYQYSYSAQMSGIYAKIGAIALLGKGLRVGAAYQTPTIMTIQEQWQHAVGVAYMNGDTYTGRTDPDLGSQTYTLITPRILTLGAAYTLGYYGILSLDYELTDYSSVEFQQWESDSYSLYNYFDGTNACMRQFAGKKHELRLGAEINITPNFVARAGFTTTSCPEKYYMDGISEVYYNDYAAAYDQVYSLGLNSLPETWKYIEERTSSFSLGIGYHSTGAFFADLAIKNTRYPASTYRPYLDYCTFTYQPATETEQEKYVQDTWYMAPKFDYRRNLFCAALTIGWKF